VPACIEEVQSQYLARDMGGGNSQARAAQLAVVMIAVCKAPGGKCGPRTHGAL
jgi:hypothetical protein